MSTDMLLHLGLHKTGTSLIQQRILAPTERVVQAYASPDIPDEERRPVRDVLRRLNSAFRFEDPAIFWSGRDADLLAILHRLPGTGPVVISSENLLTPDYFMREGEFPYPSHAGPHPVILHLDGLIRACGWRADRVRVLLGIRRQAQYLASLYAQWGYRALTTQRRFERDVRRAIRRPEGAANDHLDFHRLVAGLREVARGGVTVLPLEAIGSARYLADLAEALGIGVDRVAAALESENPVNVRSVGTAGWRLREPRGSALGPVDRLLARRPRPILMLRPELEERVRQRYGPPNRALGAAVDWDLGALGYH
jgi:hypothetical protein